MTDLIHTFVYRDVFFQLKISDQFGHQTYLDAKLYADPERNHHFIWSGKMGHPPLHELRDICDEYIEELISESIRASGEALCEICWKKLYLHPYFLGALAFGNERPYLRRRCDGRLVKL